MSKIGYVYIIRNDEHQPNRFKVGQTYDLGRRISELNRETSNVGQFYVVAKFPVEDVDKAERECHQTLREFRKAKEFFDGPEATIVSIVKKITEQYTPQLYIRNLAGAPNIQMSQPVTS